MKNKEKDFLEDVNTAESDKNPLRYPIASSRIVTIWLKKNDEGKGYFSVKLEPRFLEDANFSVRPTEKAQETVDKLVNYWEAVNQ